MTPVDLDAPSELAFEDVGPEVIEADLDGRSAITLEDAVPEFLEHELTL
jgi:hypothetical protein